MADSEEEEFITCLVNVLDLRFQIEAELPLLGEQSPQRSRSLGFTPMFE